MKVRKSLFVVAAGFVALMGVACGGDESPASTASESAVLSLHGEDELLPGFAYSTGLQPMKSQVQASFELSAKGVTTVDANAAPSGSKDAPKLNGIAGSGKVAISGGFAMIGTLKVDIPGGPSYDGPIPSLDNVEIKVEGSTPFDPFSIDKGVTTKALIPAVRLPDIPLPAGLPGVLVLEIKEGSFLEIGFTGTCAAIDGTHVDYRGDIARSGSLIIQPSVELEVLGLKKTFKIDPFTVDLALGTKNLAMAAEVSTFGAPSSGDEAKVGTCEDGAGGSGGASSSSSGTGGASSSSSGTGGASSSSSGTGGAGGSGAGGSGAGGGIPGCNDPGAEPNGTQATATEITASINCFPVTKDSQSGVLNGEADVDAYFYPNGIDVCAGPAKPWLKAYPTKPSTWFCLIPKCATTDIPDILECDDGQYYNTDGLEACCKQGGDVLMHVECTAGGTTSTSYFVYVDQPGVNECTEYGYELTFLSL